MSGQRIGIVVAAGRGERLACDVPKAFVQLRAEPLLVHSTRGMARVCDRMVVVSTPGWSARASRLLRAAGIDAQVCEGGETRTDSVAAGLASCGALELTDLVGVHDAARPLATPALIAAVFEAVAEGWDAAAPGLPVVDTLKLVDDAVGVVRTVDRQGLWTVQTPQVFRWAVLQSAYRTAGGVVTDDLGLVERAGARVRLVMGDPANIKVTYPRDLLLAEALLSR